MEPTNLLKNQFLLIFHGILSKTNIQQFSDQIPQEKDFEAKFEFLADVIFNDPS